MSKDKLLIDEIEFEMDFFTYIAGTPNFEIIAIPDLEGFIPNEEEYRLIYNDYRKKGIKLLYRVSNGRHALIYGADLEKIGIVPEDNPHGFDC